jgi:hypothetical protein
MTRPTAEYYRVRDLPRRTLSLSYAEECARELTGYMRVNGSAARLLPWQGCFLYECFENFTERGVGAWGALPVGQGKSLIAYLLGRLLKAERTLIIVPGPGTEASLRNEFASYVRDWGSPGLVKIVTRSALSPDSGHDLIANFRPTLIVIDESHKLANPKSAASRRIDRYVVEHGDSVTVVGFTGTPSRKSIMTYWHILGWCLRDYMPLPMTEGEANEWAAALDEGVFGMSYADPGVLGSSRAQARAWYRARLAETPGVVIVDEDSAGNVPLSIRWRIGREDALMNQHYETFAIAKTNPAGIDCLSGLERWRLDAQLGAGLFSRYKVQPPKEWADARRACARAVRDLIDESTFSDRPLDTPGQVFKHCGRSQEVQYWLKIKPTFKPETVVEWFSSSALEDARAWLAEERRPGVVWVGMPEFGHALAKLTGLPYYGESGRNAQGTFLTGADRNRSLIASWNANKEGFNLQAWNRALVCQPPQSALYLEQLIGRHHRRNQTEAVIYYMLISSGGGIDAFESAVRESETIKEREGLTQKLLRARVQRAAPTVTDANEFRWASRSKKYRNT